MSNAGQPQEGVSMWLRRANEKKLITAQIAIEIARLCAEGRGTDKANSTKTNRSRSRKMATYGLFKVAIRPRRTRQISRASRWLDHFRCASPNSTGRYLSVVS